jgi:hypothetical protein
MLETLFQLIPLFSTATLFVLSLYELHKTLTVPRRVNSIFLKINRHLKPSAHLFTIAAKPVDMTQINFKR